MVKKLLFDIDILLDSKGKETGICRVANQLLRELMQRPEYEIYHLISVHPKLNPVTYLTEKGLKDLVDRIVYLPNLRTTCGGYKRKYQIKAKILEIICGIKYKKELRKILHELIDLYYKYKIGLIDINIGLEAILCTYCS